MADPGSVHDELAHRAFLHDDPEAYLAGVDDALTVTGELTAMGDDPTEDGQATGAA